MIILKPPPSSWAVSTPIRSARSATAAPTPPVPLSRARPDADQWLAYGAKLDRDQLVAYILSYPTRPEAHSVM